jgi:hypothetical protein
VIANAHVIRVASSEMLVGQSITRLEIDSSRRSIVEPAINLGSYRFSVFGFLPALWPDPFVGFVAASAKTFLAIDHVVYVAGGVPESSHGESLE